MRSLFSTKHPSGKEGEVGPLVKQGFSLSMFPEYMTFIPNQNRIFLFPSKCRNDTPNNLVSVLKFILEILMFSASVYSVYIYIYTRHKKVVFYCVEAVNLSSATIFLTIKTSW